VAGYADHRSLDRARRGGFAPDVGQCCLRALSRANRTPSSFPSSTTARPVGLIERNAFLLKIAAPFGHALYAGRPVLHLMDDEPAVVEAGVSIDAFCDILLKSGPGALMRGFIVTRQGRYHGVGTAVSLLQAVNDQQRRQNEELAEQTRVLTDARTQALASARAKSQFLAIMSHELRTPMNGVLAVAELLRRQPLNTQAQAHVTTIVDSSETLLRILQDALDLSRAEAGELDLHPKRRPCGP
jgi:signal transduction histidine kinase